MAHKPAPAKQTQRRSLHVKKGDLVRVITGKSKGLEGKIISVLPEVEKVIVEGVNRVKKHTKVQQAQRGGTTGGIVTQEAPIHVSNVMLLVETTDADGKKQKVTTRVGYNRVEVQKRRPDGSTYTGFRSVRISRRTGEEI
jgi:large subunit ribosomal protein L24